MDRLIAKYDEISLIEHLDLTSEDIVRAFRETIEEDIEKYRGLVEEPLEIEEDE